MAQPKQSLEETWTIVYVVYVLTFMSATISNVLHKITTSSSKLFKSRFIF